jgi:hypothetical protein
MLSLSPSLHFQKYNKDAAAELHSAVRTGWMAAALTCALSEMAFGNASTEELNGARKFIKTFMNMAEEIVPPTPQLPNKELGQPAVKKT